MLSKILHKSPLVMAAFALLFLVSLAPSSGSAVELLTLFTTPQERQLINNNRYHVDEEPPVISQPVVQEPVDEAPEPEPLPEPVKMTEVSSEYLVSGITLSPDGAHMVWVNGGRYESGDRLEDGSRVDVLAGKEIKARITTPDGRQHVVLAGETIQASYLVPAEE